MSLCRNCGTIMEKKGNKFVCSECKYQYQKGEHNAKTLEVLNNLTYPITARILQQETYFSISTVKYCLERLCKQRRVVKYNFKKEQIDPVGSRSFEKGKTPKFYYRITTEGQKLLDYYKKKGLFT